MQKMVDSKSTPVNVKTHVSLITSSNLGATGFQLPPRMLPFLFRIVRLKDRSPNARICNAISGLTRTKIVNSHLSKGMELT